MDIFQIPGKTWWVRYSAVHGWGCSTGDGPLWFEERRIFMPLLPLLELGQHEAHQLVKEGVKRSQLPPAIAATFPLENLIVYALEWEVDSWPGEAIKWLESGFPLNRDIANALRRLSDDGRRGQRIRHRARALAKTWSEQVV